MKGKKLLKSFRKNWQIYAILLLPMAYIFIFSYMPLYGIQVAFKNFIPSRGITGSPWVGLQHFRDFFGTYFWKQLLLNTFTLNIFSLFWSFPVPIILAMMLNQLNSTRYRKFIQTVIYTPNFISVVVMVGMLYIFLSPNTGLINKAISALGGTPIFFLGRSDWFRTIYIASGIWQGAGFGTIIYFATLSSVSPELYEAATVDGANKRHKIWHIDLPALLPVVIMFLVMNTGRLLTSEFAKTLLLQQPSNLSVSDTIGVYIYKYGLAGGQFSYTAAIGLMLNVVNFIILFGVNKIAQHVGEGQSSLW